MKLRLSEYKSPSSSDSEKQRFQHCSGGIRLTMRFHSCRLQWYIRFLNALPQGNQASHFEARWITLIVPPPPPSVWAQPCLCSNDTTALPSASDAAASSSRHTRTISHIRTAALCLAVPHRKTLSQNTPWFKKQKKTLSELYVSGQTTHLFLLLSSVSIKFRVLLV